MPAPKRVLCIMDMAAVGRSSMAVVLPVLAACGVQGCPLPSVLLSSHTGGFSGVQRLDAAAFGLAALNHFVAEGVPFDGVYTGYLASAAQFEVARRALTLWPDALKVVDPAMADDGKLYGSLPADTVDNMKALCGSASLITPNLTESALLCGQDPAATGEDAPARLNALAQGRAVLITSVPGPKSVGILGCDKGGEAPFRLPVDQQPVHYPGTGDLFATAVTGLLLAGRPLRDAARAAADFIAQAVRRTLAENGEPRMGVWFEPLLPMLAAAAGPQGAL